MTTYETTPAGGEGIGSGRSEGAEAGWRWRAIGGVCLGALCGAVLGGLGCGGASTPVDAAPTQSSAARVARTIDGFAHPESVTKSGARVFVSNVGVKLEPTAKDGDGFISELAEDGRVVERRFLPHGGPPLHAPKGIAVAGGRLYVADVDAVVGFDLATRARVFEVPFEGGGTTALPNDVAVESDNALLVTDTIGSRLVRIDLRDRTVHVVATGIRGANGIAVDRARGGAWVAGIGPAFDGGDLVFVPLGSSSAPATPRAIDGIHGLLDGIALLPGGDLLVSDWRRIDVRTEGTLLRYRTASGAARVEGEGRSVVDAHVVAMLHGPADFHFDAEHRELWIPRMLDGAVTVVPID